MNPILLIRSKGWVMLIAGALFAVFPFQIIELLGGSFEPAGALMARLLGLLLLGMGWSMAFVSMKLPARSESLVYAVTDLVAVALLGLASAGGVFNDLGFALAGIYLVSALSFLYCFSQAGD